MRITLPRVHHLNQSCLALHSAAQVALAMVSFMVRGASQHESRWWFKNCHDMYKALACMYLIAIRHYVMNSFSVQIYMYIIDLWKSVQAATATVPSGGDGAPPQAGDGFTFEHLADRPELWLDFCADTGDGGNPTYAVAWAMAATSLKVTAVWQ